MVQGRKLTLFTKPEHVQNNKATVYTSTSVKLLFEHIEDRLILLNHQNHNIGHIKTPPFLTCQFYRPI